MKEHLFKQNRIEINYVVTESKGLPILLLHGVTHRWQSFLPIIPKLMENFKVYATDLRGHGKSKKYPGAYKIDSYVEDMQLFIEHQIKRSAIILGHSLGGMIALMLAAIYPKWVKALIIIDTPLNLERVHELTGHHRALLDNLGSEYIKTMYSPLMQLLPPHVQNCDLDMLLAMIQRPKEMFSSYQLEQLLPNIKCPTLIIRGAPERGSLIREDDIYRVEKLIVNLSHVLIPTVGHSPIRQDKNALLNEIKLFLKKILE
ncbi:alpha/beta fold hydrolase [Legionella cardiaca]|uniref:Alpha/beta hydrolase n=1 Tax=Legionella cardiaca TaxID=1071983 RepID=A0ABY8APZ1_9GAMM|nr:alpha/beta hydrolase [Legionella cardiaca]WED41859.1 alpha/beta hydrolase [Legionella cardiaca]